MNRLVLIALLLVATVGCELIGPGEVHEGEVRLAVPEGFAPVPIPAHNPLTAVKVDLGERLFFDPMLSRDGTISCASCHFTEHAFADPRRLSVGVEGRLGLRNSPSLVNVAYQELLFWDGGALTLENQVFGPLEDPNEMDSHLDTVLTRLNAEPTYRADFEEAFGEAATLRTLTQALASFQRTIRSGGSRADAFRAGDGEALTAAEQRGLALFEGKANCATCHSGFLLSDGSFANNGLAYVAPDSGRARITFDSADFNRFRVPSLRNVSLTAPYMHDGRFATLDQVVAHYNAGGTDVRGKDARIQPLGLSEQEKRDLVAFLEALTDTTIWVGLTP